MRHFARLCHAGHGGCALQNAGATASRSALYRNYSRGFFSSRPSDRRRSTLSREEQIGRQPEGAEPSSEGASFSHRSVDERIVQLSVMEVLEQLKKGNGNGYPRNQSWMLLMVFVGACGFTVLYMENLRASLIEATGNAAGSLLYSNTFREMSLKFLKDVAEEFLSSPDTHEMMQGKVLQVLQDSQGMLEKAIIKTLQTEDVTRASFDFTQSLVNRLCQDPEVIEMVGQCLLNAIYTETAVNGAARWFVDLTKREDTCNAIEELLSDRILSDAKLQAEALNFCKQVTNKYLNDKETMQESVKFIKALLDRPSLQAYLAQILLDIVKQSVYPKWLNSQGNPGLARYMGDIRSTSGDYSKGFQTSRFI